MTLDGTCTNNLIIHICGAYSGKLFEIEQKITISIVMKGGEVARLRQIGGETYLDLVEVTEKYSWVSSTLYHFRSLDLLETYRFVGDRKSYWKASELEAIKNRPPEVTKRGPKSNGGQTRNQPPSLTTSVTSLTALALVFQLYISMLILLASPQYY